LFFVWTAMALAPVFPLLPWFWPLLLLQLQRRVSSEPNFLGDFRERAAPQDPLQGRPKV
jgi:hypothetical protein